MSTRLRLDPHVHTDASYDATGDVEAVLRRARAAGLDAVAITDHDTTVAAREALEQAGREDLVVIPGVEVSTRDGHVLALGVIDRPPVGEPFEATVGEIRDRGGLAVVPHPFQRSRHGVPKRALVDCDGVEVFNPWAVTGIQNRRARRFARGRGYPRLAGSDAHEPDSVGRAHTEVAVEASGADALDPEAILDALAAGRTRPVGRTTSKRRYLGKYTRALGRHVLGRAR
jgi:predicted metal-dependent phosphoesterase TrpH